MRSAVRANGIILRPLLVLTALGPTMFGCLTPPAPPNDLEEKSRAIHDHPACVASLGPLGAVLGTFNSYGNWCGPSNIGTSATPPINCWDDACRTHDYAFHGPRPSGGVDPGALSCHEVLNTASGNLCYVFDLVPQTTCIAGADDVLCDGWSRCTAEAAAYKAQAATTWRLHAQGGGRGASNSRRCNDPHAGDHGMPVRCPWYEHPTEEVWTCGACPGPPPPPQGPFPDPGCAVPRAPENDNTSGSCLPLVLPAKEVTASQVEACCQDYVDAADLRAKPCECPADRPLRRDWYAGQPAINGVTPQQVLCVACPAGTTWNGSSGPCEEAYPANAAPGGATACCSACPSGLEQCNGSCVMPCPPPQIVLGGTATIIFIRDQESCACLCSPRDVCERCLRGC